jgi:ubiquitin
MGTLTYTWSGGATGTGTIKTPAPGQATTCTVTAENASDEISASLTVYKVDTALSGNVAGDAVAIAKPYGKAGDTINIDYTVAKTGTKSNDVAFTGGTVVKTDDPNKATYNIAAGDAAANGTITLTATFAHVDLPALSGTVVLTIDPATGEVTAVANVDNADQVGTLTYTWSGGAAGTGTMKTPTPGQAATCTVTAAEATGSISASVTVYKVDTALSGAVAGDAAAIAKPYGKAGDTVNIDYAVANSGTKSNDVAFTGGTVTKTPPSIATYDIVAGDATNGVITITATFTHISYPALAGTVALTIDPATGEVTAVANIDNADPVGTLTYTWSGSAAGTGTMKTPTLGQAATCTVTATEADGSISASVTVYKVNTILSGAVAGDAAAIAKPYGKAGDTVNIDYAVAETGTVSNSVAFTGGAVVKTVPNKATYNIVAGDAANGAITITATFTHSSSSGGGGGLTPPGQEATVNDGTHTDAVGVKTDAQTGTASVELSQEQVSKDKDVVVTMPKMDNISTIVLDIPVPAISQPEGQGGSITLVTDSAVIVLPSDMLTGLTSANGSRARISITVVDAADLPPAAKTRFQVIL